MTAEQAREHAQQILRERRFHGSSVPRPFHGVLVWLGDKLRPVGRLFDSIADHLPGGPYTLWVILAGLLLLAATGFSARIASRRAAAELDRRERARMPRDLDPRELEREADEAERSGDPARALRLRFRAGLLRLGRGRVVPLRESLTSGEARRLVGLPEFDRLARTHDEVVFGGRAAQPADAVDARETWPRVLTAKGVAR